jgi:hypothetical protein
MKRNLIIGAGVVVSLVALYFLFGNNAALEASDIYAEVKKGKFKVEIETTGELEAKNSVKILGPSSLMNFDIYQVTIQSIVNEGTVVKKGDLDCNVRQIRIPKEILCQANRARESQIQVQPNAIRHHLANEAIT